MKRARQLPDSKPRPLLKRHTAQVDSEIVIGQARQVEVGAEFGHTQVVGVKPLLNGLVGHIVTHRRRPDDDRRDLKVETRRGLGFVFRAQGVNHPLDVERGRQRVAPQTGIKPYELHIVDPPGVGEQTVKQRDSRPETADSQGGVAWSSLQHDIAQDYPVERHDTEVADRDPGVKQGRKLGLKPVGHPPLHPRQRQGDIQHSRDDRRQYQGGHQYGA